MKSKNFTVSKITTFSRKGTIWYIDNFPKNQADVKENKS